MKSQQLVSKRQTQKFEVWFDRLGKVSDFNILPDFSRPFDFQHGPKWQEWTIKNSHNLLGQL